MKETIIREEKEFPSDLEERLAVVLNGVNTELKSATILHLDSSPAEAAEIRARIRESRGKGYLPRSSGFDTYGKTLHNIALVAKKTVIRNTGENIYLGYSLTEAGRIYGRQVAAFSLRYSVEKGRSMYEILGSSVSRGNSRAPHNRVRILEELNREELRLIDLVDRLDLGTESILRHIDKFSKIGLINYDSVGGNQKGKSIYRWIKGKNPDDVETILRQKTLTKRVSLKLSELEEADCNMIAESLSYAHPSHISRILSGLEKQSFAKNLRWKGGKCLSNIKILDCGRRFLEEFIQPVRGILDNNFLLTREEIEKLRNEYTGRGIDLYESVSPNINDKPSKERIEQIEEFLGKNPGRTSREIGQAIGLSNWSILAYLKKIEKIRKKIEGQDTRYFPK